jgi:hypothetical protein
MKAKREDKKKDVSRELSQTIAAIKNLFGRCFNSMRLIDASEKLHFSPVPRLAG